MEQELKTKQADHETQELLQDMVENRPSKITLTSGRTVKVGWLMPDTQDKIDDIIVHHDTIAKKVESGDISVQEGNRITRQFYAKMAAAVLINNYFGLKFFWGIKWRIIHHFWHINGDDYAKIMAETKKKASEQGFLVAMAYSMTMSDLWTNLTKQEAEAFRQGLKSEKEQQS